MAVVLDVLGSWAVDGVPLQTSAYNIVSWGGTRQAPPTYRGDDATMPYQDGDVWLEKRVGARSMALEMWVIGMLTNGTVPAGMRTQFETNFRTLRALLWQPRRQFALSKQITVDGTLQTVTALAEYVSGLEPEMNGRLRAEFTVDLKLADPYFYGPAISQSAGSSVTVPGDERTSHVIVTLPAGATLTQSNGWWIKNNGSATATVNVKTGVVTGVTNGYIDHNSAKGKLLFPFDVGTTSLTGSGSVAISPAWL